MDQFTYVRLPILNLEENIDINYLIQQITTSHKMYVNTLKNDKKHNKLHQFNPKLIILTH